MAKSKVKSVVEFGNKMTAYELIHAAKTELADYMEVMQEIADADGLVTPEMQKKYTAVMEQLQSSGIVEVITAKASGIAWVITSVIQDEIDKAKRFKSQADAELKKFNKQKENLENLLLGLMISIDKEQLKSGDKVKAFTREVKKVNCFNEEDAKYNVLQLFSQNSLLKNSSGEKILLDEEQVATLIHFIMTCTNTIIGYNVEGEVSNVSISLKANESKNYIEDNGEVYYQDGNQMMGDSLIHDFLFIRLEFSTGITIRK